MIDICLMIISFIFFWIFGFFIHEIGHYLGARLTGGNAKIRIWFYKNIIPSMETIPSGTYNRPIFLISGGIFTCVLYMIFILISQNIYIMYPCFIIGYINLIYAYYETAYIDVWSRDKYMFFHYVLYAVVFLILNGVLFLVGAIA
jgi:hypothetical protein